MGAVYTTFFGPRHLDLKVKQRKLDPECFIYFIFLDKFSHVTWRRLSLSKLTQVIINLYRIHRNMILGWWIDLLYV